MMDPSSFFLLLSHLLHLHHDNISLSSPSPPLSPSSPAALLFFTLATILSFYSTSSSSSKPSPSPPPRSFTLFHATDRILSISDPSTRDQRWRSLHGISYPAFRSLLDHLSALSFPSQSLPLPPDRALSLALVRLHLRKLPKPLPVPPVIVNRALNCLTRLLATKLYPAYLKPPHSARLLHTLHSFRDLSGLPHLAGTLFSSAIRIIGNDCEQYLFPPGKDYPAVLLQGVVDSRKIFWDACVRAPGSAHPVDHFRDSKLYSRLLAGDMFRDSTVLVRGVPVRPYVAGGDSLYPLMPFLIVPFDGAGKKIGQVEEAFNKAVAKARVGSAEAAVALLKGRWQILRNLNVGLDHAAQTVVACCVLHNMCQIAGEPEDDVWHDPPEQPPPPARLLETELSLHQAGETVRWAIAEDLYERQQQRIILEVDNGR